MYTKSKNDKQSTKFSIRTKIRAGCTEADCTNTCKQMAQKVPNPQMPPCCAGMTPEKCCEALCRA